MYSSASSQLSLGYPAVAAPPTWQRRVDGQLRERVAKQNLSRVLGVGGIGLLRVP